MTMGQLIKKRRIELGVTQAKLAKLLGYSVPQLISNVERGACGFPKNKIKKLCRVLMLDQAVVFNTLVNEETDAIAKAVGYEL